jgi:hypothetical protein
MAYEVINSVKGKVTIRAVNAGTYTIELTGMQANSNIETVSAASITDIAWATSGFISVSRNTTPVLNLMGSGQWTNMDGILPKGGANTSTSNVVIVINTGGTVILGLSKVATYNVDTQRALN